METPTYHLSHPQTPLILRLPPHVRHRIYLHAGLVLTTRTGYSDAFDLSPSYNNSRYHGFNGLLRSSRIIYTEVSTLLYSSNDFFIRYWDQRSLEALRNLTPHSLSKLTRLKIILNEASCPSSDWGGVVPWQTKGDHTDMLTECDSDGRLKSRDIPLNSRQPLAEAIIDAWNASIDHLSLCITPNILELCVVCDVHPEDIEIAKRVVNPLASLPLLKNCHLRLCRTPTAALNELARLTVLQVRGVSDVQASLLPALGQDISCASRPGFPTASGSRLLALPQELRFRILEFTDLITPWKEVTWSRQYQGFIESKTFCFPLDARGEECPPHKHHGCQFHNCWETYPERSLGCFCRIKHSAFSSGCKCWAPPQDLFLVCRSLYMDSQIVFYSGNKFVIHDFNFDPPWELPFETQFYPSPPLAASIFLSEIVPEYCLSELRSVEFVFPPYHHEDWPQEGQAALEDWARTVEWASKRLSLPALTIRLAMSYPCEWDIPKHRRFMTREQGEEILAAYMRILAPLVPLGSDGLARFYACLIWPWKYTDETMDTCVIKGWEWVEAHEKVMKDRAERLVMGDRYHSLFDGDGEPPDSLWVRTFQRDA